MLLGVPSATLNGSAAWIIMTGTTLSVRGYNSLIAKIVPLTVASRSADLIPYMLVRAGGPLGMHGETRGSTFWPHPGALISLLVCQSCPMHMPAHLYLRAGQAGHA